MNETCKSSQVTHTLIMSHNSKYYLKRIKKGESASNHTLFKYMKVDNVNDQSKVKDNHVSEKNISVENKTQTEIQNDDQMVNKVSESDIDNYEIGLNKNITTVTENIENNITSVCESGISDSEFDNRSSDHSSHSDSESDNCESTRNSSTTSSVSKGFDSRLFFAAKYEGDYPWLYFSVAKNGYFCKYCELFAPTYYPGMKRSFIEVGVMLGTHPTRKLMKHSECNRHKLSVELFQNSKSEEKIKNPLLKLWKKVDENNSEKQKKIVESNRKYVSKLTASAYFMIRKKWAVTDNFEDFVRFLGDMGVSEISSYLVGNPKATYLSSKSVTDIVYCISRVLENKLLDSLNKAEHFSLLADESTDEHNRTQLSIMCRWHHQGTFTEHYMGLVNVAKTDAQSLMECIETFCVTKNIDLKKITFVGFDGTNTMSGEKTGLQRRMRNKAPHSLYINCRNHRLALCIKHLISKFKILDEVDATLLSLWKLFEYSPQKLHVFQDVQTVYGVRNYTILKAVPTRWLSHYRACCRVMDRYVMLIDTLDAIYNKKKEPEVFGIRTALTKKNVVAMILLLCDVLKPLQHLSSYLQGEYVNFARVEHHVTKCTDELHKIIHEIEKDSIKDINSEFYFSKIDEIFQEISDRADLAQRKRGHAFDISPEQFVQDTGIPFIYGIISELESAFHCEKELKAFSIFEPRNLPVKVEELPEYGKEEILTLAEFYGNAKTDVFQGHTNTSLGFFPPELAVSEFAAFKSQMFVIREKQNIQTPAELFKVMEKDSILKTCFPTMFLLLYLCLLIPASTASVERSFSLMNLLCTPLRNRLSQASLDALMRICNEGPDKLDSDMLDMVIEVFKTMSDRLMDL